MSRPYLTRTAGDFGETTTFNLEESDGTASDLSGNTGVRIHIRIEGDIPGVDALRVDQPVVVDADPITGKVTYQWKDGDLDVAGKYYVQFEAVFPTREITWDLAIINVEEQHG